MVDAHVKSLRRHACPLVAPGMSLKIKQTSKQTNNEECNRTTVNPQTKKRRSSVQYSEGHSFKKKKKLKNDESPKQYVTGPWYVPDHQLIKPLPRTHSRLQTHPGYFDY